MNGRNNGRYGEGRSEKETRKKNRSNITSSNSTAQELTGLNRSHSIAMVCNNVARSDTTLLPPCTYPRLSSFQNIVEQPTDDRQFLIVRDIYKTIGAGASKSRRYPIVKMRASIQIPVLLLGIVALSSLIQGKDLRWFGESGDDALGSPSQFDLIAAASDKHWKKGGGDEHHSEHHSHHGEKGEKG